MTESSTTRRVQVTDLVVGVVTTAFGCFSLFALIPLGVEDPGSINVRALGPAFWPSIVSGLLIAMGVIITVQAARRLQADNTDEEAGGGFATMRWLAALVLLAGLYVGLHILGMVLASMIALAAFMLLGGERRALLIAIISLALPLVLFVFFRYVANVVIPLGVLEPWLG